MFQPEASVGLLLGEHNTGYFLQLKSFWEHNIHLSSSRAVIVELNNCEGLKDCDCERLWGQLLKSFIGLSQLQLGFRCQKHITVQYSTMQKVTVHYVTVQFVTVRYFTVEYITVQYVTSHYVTVQYSTVRYITIQHITVRYITVQFVTVIYIKVQQITVKYVTTPEFPYCLFVLLVSEHIFSLA